MKDDPYEKHDLAAVKPERMKRMIRALESHMKAAQEIPWERPADGVDLRQ